MWTIEAVRRYVDLGTNKEGQQVGFWDTHHIARNQAGIAIYSIGGGREHQERFQYEGPEISFDFWADRYDGYGRLTDTYRVPMILPGKLSLSEARAIETRIREALLALPPQPKVMKAARPRRWSSIGDSGTGRTPMPRSFLRLLDLLSATLRLGTAPSSILPRMGGEEV